MEIRTTWQRDFPLLAQMEATPQDAVWHGEGNFSIHTGLVLNEVRKLILVLALAETILFQEVRSIRQNRHQGCAGPGFDGTILGVGAADFDLVGGDQFESAEDGLLGDSGGAGQFPVPAVAGDGEGFIPRLDFRLTESGENDNAT